MRLKLSLAEDQYKEQRVKVEDIRHNLRQECRRLDALDGQRQTYRALMQELMTAEAKEAAEARKTAEEAAGKKKAEEAAAINRAIDEVSKAREADKKEAVPLGPPQKK